MSAPRLECIPCTVCNSLSFDIICSAREVEVQQEFLRIFHRRRLIPGSPPSALEERADFTQDYPTDIVACRECGLVFRNPRPTPEAIRRMYAQDQYDPSRLEAVWDSQVELYRPKAQTLARWLPPGSSVVEVGSFVGGFLKAGQGQGWAMQGVDPGEEVSAFCEGKGFPVTRGTLEDLSLTEGSVDGLAIWNTFDQIPEPDPTLAAVRRLLRPGGVLALRVPNGESFRWGTEGIHRLHAMRGPFRALLGPLLSLMAWNNLLFFPYLHGYSVRTLDRLLCRYGFRRRWIVPDTLCRLSDDRTKSWAAGEERLSKAATRIVARVQALNPAGPLTFSPWLDAYYVRR
ncbi:MAG: class I SAM-dependent methyltransferase [Armatimonadetes bacterium]|nr:class I SAM-dependent methyltransferase [Armatimonadota bacterium]